MNSSETSSSTPSAQVSEPINATGLGLSYRTAHDAVFSSSRTVREWYGDKPVMLIQMLDSEVRFPAKIREIFMYIWLERGPDGKRARRFIIKGPRGGGKSALLGSIGFAKWFLQLRKIVDMGGSLAQAQGVYNYFAGYCYAKEGILKSLPDEPTLNRSVTEFGNYFRAVAASAKAVRGPHPDGLFADETCEIKDELLLAAMPMVNTSQHSLIVMTSTFHKIFGLFQETWDAADEKGYVRFSWDMFDVTAPFSPFIWSNPELREAIPDLSIEQAGEKSLEARAAGRTGDPEGWVPVDNIIQAWREKDSLDWFDVEYMGARPSAVGMVNDPADVDACLFDTKPFPEDYRYVPGLDSAAGIDWGFAGMTSMTGLHVGKDMLKINHFQKTYTGQRSGVIIKDAIEGIRRFGWKAIYCDASHPFENADLKAAIIKAFNGTNVRCSVIEVAFGSEKEWMLGNYRTHFSRRLMRIPGTDDFKPAVWQHKRYRYQIGKNGERSDKPLKQDDHIPDSTMLALSRWPINRVKTALPKSTVKQTPKDRARENIPTSTITGGMMDEHF